MQLLLKNHLNCLASARAAELCQGLGEQGPTSLCALSRCLRSATQAAHPVLSKLVRHIAFWPSKDRDDKPSRTPSTLARGTRLNTTQQPLCLASWLAPWTYRQIRTLPSQNRCL